MSEEKQEYTKKDKIDLSSVFESLDKDSLIISRDKDTGAIKIYIEATSIVVLAALIERESGTIVDLKERISKIQTDLADLEDK